MAFPWYLVPICLYLEWCGAKSSLEPGANLPLSIAKLQKQNATRISDNYRCSGLQVFWSLRLKKKINMAFPWYLVPIWLYLEWCGAKSSLEPDANLPLSIARLQKLNATKISDNYMCSGLEENWLKQIRV